MTISVACYPGRLEHDWKYNEDRTQRVCRECSAFESLQVRDQNHDHGRGTAERGPSDCPCRGTDKQKVCASAGCGLCLSAHDAEMGIT